MFCVADLIAVFLKYNCLVIEIFIRFTRRALHLETLIYLGFTSLIWLININISNILF